VAKYAGPWPLGPVGPPWMHVWLVVDFTKVVVFYDVMASIQIKNEDIVGIII